MHEFRTMKGMAVKGLLTVLAWLPLRAVHALGSAAGWCAWVLDVGPCRVAAANIAACMPELDPAARARLVRASMIENGKTLFEFAPLWLWRTERVLALFRETVGFDALREAHASGQGVIIIAPHHGAWEAAAIPLSHTFPMTIMYAPGKLGLDATIRDARERAGAKLVQTDRNGVKVLANSLRQGALCGILPDQDPGPDSGVFAGFFGVATKTTTLPSKLAMRTGAKAFITWAERLPRARGYRLHCRPAPEAFYHGPVEDSVAAMNASIEDAVRRNPEQYLWAYKRFRTRPEGEGRFYTR